MGRKALVICEMCGGGKPSGRADFLVFHCLTFCSPVCLDDYKAADDARRASKEAAGQTSAPKRSRAA